MSWVSWKKESFRNYQSGEMEKTLKNYRPFNIMRLPPYLELAVQHHGSHYSKLLDNCNKNHTCSGGQGQNIRNQKQKMGKTSEPFPSS